MEPRKLKALLAALGAAGVTSYRDADVTLTLGTAPMLAPTGDVEGVDESWKTAPSGLQQALTRIEKAYERKAS